MATNSSAHLPSSLTGKRRRRTYMDGGLDGQLLLAWLLHGLVKYTVELHKCHLALGLVEAPVVHNRLQPARLHLNVRQPQYIKTRRQHSTDTKSKTKSPYMDRWEVAAISLCIHSAPREV